MNYVKQRYESYIAVEKLIEKYYNYDLTYSKCRNCSGFAGTWSCPDFDFNPRDFLSKYSRLHLIVDKVFNTGTANVTEAQNRLFSEKDVYDKEMLMLERNLQNSMSLAAQECTHCNKCARLSGHPCIHPDLMRYALESIGVLATQLVKDEFGFDVLWSDGKSIPEYYVLIGGLLEK